MVTVVTVVTVGNCGNSLEVTKLTLGELLTTGVFNCNHVNKELLLVTIGTLLATTLAPSRTARVPRDNVLSAPPVLFTPPVR